MDPPSRETLVLLEEVAANAVAPTVVQLVDGWLLRAWPEAPFRRPNSVLAVRGGAHGLTARLAIVEDFYRRRGLPVRYQIGAVVEPPGLEEQLAARGYAIEAALLLQIACVAEILRGRGQRQDVPRRSIVRGGPLRATTTTLGGRQSDHSASFARLDRPAGKRSVAFNRATGVRGRPRNGLGQGPSAEPAICMS